MTILPPTRTDPLDTEHYMLWAARNPNGRARMSCRKYSVALMDIAAKIVMEQNINKAVEKTGVNKWSIKKHMAALRKAGKLAYKPTKPGVIMGAKSPVHKPKYKPETMRAIMLSGIAEHEETGRPLRGCVLRAAKAYGLLNPRYAWERYKMGLLKL